MKSRKILLIVFLVITSVIGLAALQENISGIAQVAVSEFSSEAKTVTVAISDGISSKNNG